MQENFAMDYLSKIDNVAKLLGADVPDEQERKNAQLTANFDNKLFEVATTSTPRCFFCQRFSFELQKAACGCIVCVQCLYGELPSIPLAKCPQCQSNIYPAQQDEELQKQIDQQQVLCRFHEAVSPVKSVCRDVICGQKQYYKNLCSCNKQNRLDNDNFKLSAEELNENKFQQQLFKCSLKYENSLQSQTLKQLFNENQSILQDQITLLLPAKNPIICHIIADNLILNQEEIKYQHYVNFQLLVFKNPLLNDSLNQFNEILIGLQITLPDRTIQQFEFCTDKQRLSNQQISRFFGRITTQQSGRYQFQAQICLCVKFNGQLQYVVSKISQYRFVTYPQACLFNQQSIYDLLQLQENEQVSLFYSGLCMGLDIIQRGVILFLMRIQQQEIQKQQNNQQNLQFIAQLHQLYVASNEAQFNIIEDLTLIDLNALLTFAGFAVTINDTILFLISLRGFLLNSKNLQILTLPSCIDVIIQKMDQYQKVYCVQKLVLDFLKNLMLLKVDMNAVSVRSPGLFGRVRRLQVVFPEKQDVLQIIQMMHEISQQREQPPIEDGVELQKDEDGCVENIVNKNEEEQEEITE